jgi:hypothetical protein
VSELWALASRCGIIEQCLPVSLSPTEEMIYYFFACTVKWMRLSSNGGSIFFYLKLPCHLLEPSRSATAQDATAWDATQDAAALDAVATTASSSRL